VIARAPGKLVVSGAYAVLHGAPAIVTAVDRYVVADSSRQTPLVTAEVRCALGVARAPWFDASALRSADRKLGLGSSAAIVVASLAAVALDEEPEMGDSALAARVFPGALRAHREAQGGGSGVDVAASAFGGTLLCRVGPGGLEHAACSLPSDLRVEVWAAPHASSTAEMIRAVTRWGAAAPAAHGRVMARLTDAAEAAAGATDAPCLLEALRAQRDLLAELGDGAGVPIVPASLRELAREEERADLALLPSGAGGGDVLLWVGLHGADCPAERLASGGFERLGVRIGARGVHAVRQARDAR
jgi:phosphomevalonate kinase